MVSYESVRLAQEEILLERALGPAWTIEVHDSVTSTMDAARAVLRQAASEAPLLVLAHEQRAGRGRQGRVWESPSGGLYATWAFRSDDEKRDFSGFSLAAGVAVAKALGLSRDRLQLKWPNDLIAAGGRKLGGILIEILRGEHGATVLAGIGINLFRAGLARDDAIALDEIAERQVSAPELAGCLSDALHECFRCFLDRGFAAFIDEWMAQAAHLGAHMAVDVGERTIEGVCMGVNEDGALLLRTGAGIVPVIAGHVTRTQDRLTESE